MPDEEWNKRLDSLPTPKPFEDNWDEDDGDDEPSEAKIEWQNLHLLRQQKIFRIAAGYIAEEFQQFDWIAKIAIIPNYALGASELPQDTEMKRLEGNAGFISMVIKPKFTKAFALSRLRQIAVS